MRTQLNQPRAALADAPAAAATALSPQEWRAFTLVHKETLTHGVPAPTKLFRFAQPDGEPKLPVGLPVASCMLVRAPIGTPKEDGSPGFVIRPYTPVSHPHEKGHFELVRAEGACGRQVGSSCRCMRRCRRRCMQAIKVYPGGKMGQHIDSMPLGSTLECKGECRGGRAQARLPRGVRVA